MNCVALLAAVVLLIAGSVRALTVPQTVIGTGSSAQRALGNKFARIGCSGVDAVKYIESSSVIGMLTLKGAANTNVDFALSDIPDVPCSALTSPLLNVPYGLGLMAIHARPGTITGLQLDACALDRIYKCVATSWADPYLVGLNPRLKTYAKSIVKIARNELSGSTYVFTNFLSKACPSTWKYGAITLLSIAKPLTLCFALMVPAIGTSGVQVAFGSNAGGTPNAIAYASAYSLNYGEVALKATVGGRFFYPAAVNTTALVQGLAYGSPTCNANLDVTAKGATYPLAYVTFFMVNKKRKARPNIVGVLNLCNCIVNTKNTLLFTGLKAFRAAPFAMKVTAVRRCSAILLT